MSRISPQDKRNLFVRFSAPVDVCLKYAAQVTQHGKLSPLDSDGVYCDLEALYSAFNIFRQDLRWFDLPYARDYWTTTNGSLQFRKPDYGNIPAAPNFVAGGLSLPSDSVSVDVDTSRGVFYFYTKN